MTSIKFYCPEQKIMRCDQRLCADLYGQNMLSQTEPKEMRRFVFLAFSFRALSSLSADALHLIYLL